MLDVTQPIVPGSDEWNAASPVRGNTINANTEELWDSAVYPAAGASKISFFTVPLNGQLQNGAAGALKTYADTNFDQNAQLGQGTSFAAFGIELHVFPGISVGGEGEGEGAPAQLDYTDDVLALFRFGWAEIYLQQNNLVQRIHALMMPPSTRAAGFAALSDATSAAASQRTSISYSTLCGEVKSFMPWTITPNTAFRIDFQWQNNAAPAAAPALPSGSAALLRLVLRGQKFRNS